LICELVGSPYFRSTVDPAPPTLHPQRLWAAILALTWSDVPHPQRPPRLWRRRV